MTTPLDCLCAGIIVADHVCAPIDAWPRSGGLVLTDRTTFAIGGCAANVAADLSRLGLRAGIAGMVGRDTFGREMRRMMLDANVDCAAMVESQTQPTSATLIINVKGEDRRFIHCVGANGEYDGSDITDAQLDGVRVLYVGGFCLMDALGPEAIQNLFRRARARNVLTVLDVVLPEDKCWKEWVAAALPLTDLFFPNQDEGHLLLGIRDPIAQAKEFRAMGVKTVIVTCGEQGSVMASVNSLVRAGTFPVDVIDGTGAGDAFLAGFILGMLEGVSPEDRLSFGAALGASCVSGAGATTSVFNRNQLREFLKTHTLDIERLE